MTTRPDESRVAGILLGAAVGDALGWPQEVRGGLVGGQKARDSRQPVAEFRAWTRISGRYSGRYRDPVQEGEYSDDTQLLCATARACLTGENWFDQLTTSELPSWPFYQRGGGGAVLSAAASWANGRPPWSAGRTAKSRAAKERYMGAGANGAAMRIAPHVIVADEQYKFADRVLRDGLSTHGHPRALVGAILYAAALDRALRADETVEYGDLLTAAHEGLVGTEQAVASLPDDWGDPQDRDRFAAAWDATCQEAGQLLLTVAESLERGAMSKPEITLANIGSTDPKINGAGTVTAIGAIYLASRFAARPIGGLVTGAFLRRGDTDTLASMAAALLGAIHGPGWLGPLADTVQDSDYLAWLATKLAHGTFIASSVPDAPALLLGKRLLDRLPPTGDTTEGSFPDGRHCQLLDVKEIDQGRTVRVRLILEDGQTAIVDRVSEHKIRPSSAPGDIQLAFPEQLAKESKRPVETLTTRPGAAVRLTLATGQLTTCAAFYARLLGTDVPVRGGTASVAPWLVLRQTDLRMQPDSRLVIDLIVSDPQESLVRIGVNPASAADGDSWRTRDPDGRHLRIERAGA